MKHLLFIIIPSLLFIISCTKHSAVTNASIDGTWELTKISGNITLNYPSGNGNLLKFSDSTYQLYTSGTLKKNGTFTLMQDSTASSFTCLVFSAGQFNTRIVFDTVFSSPKTFVQIKDNTLSFVSGCFANDGGSFTYYARK